MRYLIAAAFLALSSAAAANTTKSYTVERYVICYTPLLKEYKVGMNGVTKIALTDSGITVIDVVDNKNKKFTTITYSPGIACTHATVRSVK